MEWDSYFLNIAKEVSRRSKDPSSKVGCVLVTEDNRPISFGYNGFVAGCDENQMTFERPLKYNLTIHAEMNALMHAHRSLKGCKAYVTHGPCDNCLKHLLQAGLSEIIYDDPGILKDRGTPDQKEAIKRLLMSADMVCRNVNGRTYLEDLELIR